MKKLTIFAALCALLLGSCAENNLDGVTPENNITLPDLTAGFAEDETKTYVHNNTYLRWHEADLITAFYGNSLNRQYKFKGKTGDNSGTFSLIPSGELGTGNDLGAIYAVYPYDENAGINDETRVISLTLPATQTYAENSFGKGANTMIAVTENIEDTFLGFKNACGYLKLKLYGEDVTLASVEVKGNNGEKIAGSATATMEFGGVPTLAMNNDATTTVTLDCGEGIVLGATADTATELWIVLPETTFEGGITITATDTEGITFEKSTNNTIAIVRNEIQPMAALEVEFVIPEPKPANNEIWYTATEKVTPYNANVFGANIVSNEWNETTGEGVITFDGNVTSIGEMAFMYSRFSSITIPDSVTEIGYGAFSECINLDRVKLGNGIISIGDHAFFACISLESITIPEGVISIGHAAFNYCTNLVDITIPDSVTSIGEYVFADCPSLPVENNIKYADTYAVEVLDKTLTTYTIREGTRFIGTEAFRECSILNSITIPDCVTSIGGGAFVGCSSLASVAIPDSVTSIGGGAFQCCSSLESIAIPDSVTSIGESVFSECANLASVTISDNVTKIAGNAFSFCSSLASVTIPDSVTSIGEYAFSGCSSLESITIPDSVTEIENYAFWWCSNLASITIPNGISSIGCGAFVGCSNLAEFNGKFATQDGRYLIIDGSLSCFAPAGLTECFIPDGVTSIGEYVFSGCANLASVTISDNVTKIAGNAFSSCSGLTSVTIPDSVTSIGERAFDSCSGLTSVTIPDSVTSIGDQAFNRCSSLESITIPDSVTSIGYYAFNGCSSLVSVYCKPTTPPEISFWGSRASGHKFYVPAESVEAYKAAENWSRYADAIEGYDFE